MEIPDGLVVRESTGHGAPPVEADEVLTGTLLGIDYLWRCHGIAAPLSYSAWGPGWLWAAAVPGVEQGEERRRIAVEWLRQSGADVALLIDPDAQAGGVVDGDVAEGPVVRVVCATRDAETQWECEVPWRDGGTEQVVLRWFESEKDDLLAGVFADESVGRWLNRKEMELWGIFTRVQHVA